jgi:CheY-like chemotaxis protein
MKRCLDGNAPNITREPIVLPERSSVQAKPADATSEDLISEKVTKATDTAPAVPAQQAEPPTNPISETPEAATEKPGARILVVEDNKINLNLMLAFLKKRGLAALDSAENGKAAVSAVKEEQQGYDIIFMGRFPPCKHIKLDANQSTDISMPVMNGFEAARTIRAFEKGRGDGLKRSKIIALTGLSSVSDEMEALDSGINLFLTKPVAFKEVQKILDRWDRGESDPEQEDADSE